MSKAPERIWALHYECEDEPDAIAIGYPEKFFGAHEYVRADRVKALEDAASALRAAQRAYMADRGNNALGAKVGQAAAHLDAVLTQKDQTND
jgi:hypothetical protein